MNVPTNAIDTSELSRCKSSMPFNAKLGDAMAQLAFSASSAVILLPSRGDSPSHSKAQSSLASLAGDTGLLQAERFCFCDLKFSRQVAVNVAGAMLGSYSGAMVLDCMDGGSLEIFGGG